MQKFEIRPHPTSYVKINSKQIKFLNTTPEKNHLTTREKYSKTLVQAMTFSLRPQETIKAKINKCN